jgi:DNA-binding response OmpR family regulator
VGQAATKDYAMMEPATKARNVIAFGPFSLDASRRLLLKNDSELGARTPDILIELVSRPNEVVSKNDLLAQVWPGAPVEKGSLRFHIFGLRNARRGYCFMAGDRVEEIAAAARFPYVTLPARLIGMFGRDRG